MVGLYIKDKFIYRVLREKLVTRYVSYQPGGTEGNYDIDRGLQICGRYFECEGPIYKVGILRTQPRHSD
jgi:hypothetical protein